MKKKNTQYGIEITKPFSKAMYDHNDKVADQMKKNILNAWEALIEELGACSTSERCYVFWLW